MMASRLLPSLLLPILLVQVVKVLCVENKSDEECRKAGFNKETLQCSSCAQLPAFHLDNLLDVCTACCTRDEAELQHEKYPAGVIEVCECNLARFPQVQAFVRSNMAKRWGTHVKVKHVRGTLPTIKLNDAHGETQETLNIEKWDTDTITDFLNSWIDY